MMKQKISGWFIAAALLLVIAHAAVPHHHHGNLICFNPRCVETCCCHHEHQHDNEQGAPSCQCHHHHHSADECTVYAPYLLDDDARDLCKKIVSVKDFSDCNFIGIISEIVFIELECVDNHFLIDDNPPIPISPVLAFSSLRAPPAV